MFSFYKMQITGNDFIIVNFLENRLEYSFKLLSKFLCDRHFGVGGDCTLILENSEVADFKIRFFNKDGEELQMCGNGIICMAKYIYENKLIDKTEFEFETNSGLRSVRIELEDNNVGEIELEIGEAQFNLQNLPIIYLENNYQGILHIENMEIYPILIEEPYAICFVDDVSKINIRNLGRLIENYKYFPNKINVGFVQIINNEKIKIRTWKLGIGEVLSNGIAACATAVVMNKYKSTNSAITVDLLGGSLKVNCENNIKLIGRAENVFQGNIVI